MKRTVEVDGHQIHYDCPNQGTEWRAETLFTKEPDTIAWIDSFDRGDLLMDIGANVGMYTIYAAGIRGILVDAFEPESGNFAALVNNIRLNDLESMVMAYPVAMSDKCGFSEIFLSVPGVGGSGHTVGEPLSQHLKERRFNGRHGVYATTIDDFVAETGRPPDHIKIDVDALEHLIINGGWKTVSRDTGPSSILCEINTSVTEHQDIIETLDRAGFEYSVAPGAIRTEGPFKGIGNHIFRRT